METMSNFTGKWQVLRGKCPFYFDTGTGNGKTIPKNRYRNRYGYRNKININYIHFITTKTAYVVESIYLYINSLDI